MSDQNVSASRYDFKTVEKKWQQIWEQDSSYRAFEDP